MQKKTRSKIKKNQTPRGHYSNKGGSIPIVLGGYGMRIAPQDLWKVYRMNADVFGCIRELKQGVGAGGHRFFDPKDREIEPNKDILSSTDIFFQNSGGLDNIKSLSVRDGGISGNSYFEIVEAASGKPWGLKRLNPRTMYIIADNHGTVLKYVQRVYGANDVYFEPWQVLHIIADEDPDNEILGMSPLETALWEARTDIAAAQSNYSFFENDAVPSNLYILDDGLSPEEQKIAMKEINEQFSGAKNRHKSAAMAGVKEIKTLSMSQKDMEFVVGRKFNTDKVCTAFGVPKYILGNTESVNYSNGEGLMKKFYDNTLKPLEKIFLNAINTQLFKKLGIADKIRIEFLPQTFGEEKENAKFALEEYKAGALTLRQYKVKTGQKVTQEDEQETMIDRHIIHSGGSATLMDDVGVDPVVDPTNPETANNIVKALQTKAMYEQRNN